MATLLVHPATASQPFTKIETVKDFIKSTAKSCRSFSCSFYSAGLSSEACKPRKRFLPQKINRYRCALGAAHDAGAYIFEQEAASPAGDVSYSGSVSAASESQELSASLGGGSDNGAGSFNGGNGGGNGGDGSGAGGEKPVGWDTGGLLGVLLKGWNDRVSADPQFIFKVLTEQIIGVSACVIGDMASRPNFGLNELDFVFSTLVVGSLMNFALMYLLAPTGAASMGATLPGIFASCPSGHMFEQGSYSLAGRAGTFVYKGLQFATVGFAAGLVGTVLSNVLLKMRKLLQPGFVLQNEAPPPLLNSGTWALHMGISSNLRYQCLNGLDHILAQSLSPGVFRALVFGIRGANNVVGGSTFAMLAKVTGAQKAGGQLPQEITNGEIKEEGSAPITAGTPAEL